MWEWFLTKKSSRNKSSQLRLLPFSSSHFQYLTISYVCLHISEVLTQKTMLKRAFLLKSPSAKQTWAGIAIYCIKLLLFTKLQSFKFLQNWHPKHFSLLPGMSSTVWLLPGMSSTVWLLPGMSSTVWLLVNKFQQKVSPT